MREWRILRRWGGGALAALGLIGGPVLIPDGPAMAVLGINGTVGAPSSTVAGAVVTFSGEVSNTGTGASEDFTHVTIVDDGSLGLSNVTSLGTGAVPAGVSSLPFTVTATITGPPSTQAQLMLKATGVTASSADVDPQADIDGSAFVISLAPTLTTQINATGTEPGVLGETILGDTATLTGFAGSVAGETVTFHLYGPFAEGVTPVCTGTPVFTTTGALNAGGVATTSVLYEPIAEGTYTWQASYPGNAANAPATHACNQVSETITVVAPRGRTSWCRRPTRRTR